MKPVYIKSAIAISPQPTFAVNRLPDHIASAETSLLRCIEPQYAQFLNPVMARRMSKVLKMGMASAIACLKEAKLEQPDAIIVGTALGCLADTEKFLTAIIQDDEQFLTPTSFIQSIQNTVSAQIALHLKCTAHNFTFVHKGFSFESALLESMMLLGENESRNILVGGLDELTENNFTIYQKLGAWKKESFSSKDLISQNTEGTIAGEGSSFFMLGNEPGENDFARLLSVKTIYKPDEPSEINRHISDLLSENNLVLDDISLILFGYNGDAQEKGWYDKVLAVFSTIPAGYFKHLCGEHQTSGAFAMWLAAQMLRTGVVPGYVTPGKMIASKPSTILIYNNYENDHVLMLLSDKK